MPVQPRALTSPESGPRGSRLDSWKEIAGYLNRHVTTVRRWERHEGLPVHRHRHARIGSIYAYTRELDAWFESRLEEGHASTPATPDWAGATSGFSSPRGSRAGPLPEPVVLTGRDGELELLERAWERTSAGQQQVVLVTGEPGIGKTRLALEFARRIAVRCDWSWSGVGHIAKALVA